MPGQSGPRAGLATTRFALLKQILALTEQQRLALRAEQLDRFAALLDDRQVLLDALTAADSPAAERPGKVIRFPGSGAPEDAEAIGALLHTILTIDAESDELLGETRQGLLGGLRSLTSGRLAARGYAPGGMRAGRQGRRLDRSA